MAHFVKVILLNTSSSNVTRIAPRYCSFLTKTGLKCLSGRSTDLGSRSCFRSLSTQPSQPQSKSQEIPGDPSRLMHRPSDFDKSVLVKAKMFKTLEEVPDEVSFAKMKKAKDWFRIRVSLWMIAGTLLGCVVMIVTGRRSRDAGDSLSKRGLDHQNRMRQQGIAEEEAKKKADSAQG